MDFQKLDDDREEAIRDKCDLFDFYHTNWKKLIDRLKKCERNLQQIVDNSDINLCDRDKREIRRLLESEL